MSTCLPVGYRAEKYALSSDSLGRRGFQPPGRRHRRISGGGGRISAGGRSVRLIGQAVLAGPECRLRAVVHADLAKQIGRDTSELQSLMRISYAVFCLKQK